MKAQKNQLIINTKKKKKECKWKGRKEKRQSEIKNHTKHFRLVSNDDLLTHPPTEPPPHDLTTNNVAALTRLLVPPPPLPMKCHQKGLLYAINCCILLSNFFLLFFCVSSCFIFFSFFPRCVAYASSSAWPRVFSGTLSHMLSCPGQLDHEQDPSQT